VRRLPYDPVGVVSAGLAENRIGRDGDAVLAGDRPPSQKV